MTESTAEKKPTAVVTGTPDAPAFTRRPMVFVVTLVVYAMWLALLIMWAVKLRRGH